MDEGEHDTTTEVIVGVAITVTAAEPDLVVSSVEVAVMLVVPVPDGVNNPPELIVPSVAVQDTPEL